MSVMSVEDVKAVDCRKANVGFLVKLPNDDPEPEENTREKITVMLNRVQNPYVYDIDGVKIRLTFAKNTRKSIEDCMHGYFGGL